MTLIDFATAQAIVARIVEPLPSEVVALADAHGRVLAQPVIAAIAAPGLTQSERDGYAVRDADVPGPGTRLRVVGTAWPGQPALAAIGPAEAVRIVTGAPLPAGADRVIMQEHVTRSGDGVLIGAGYGPGWHVRAHATDFAAGATILPAGARLSARALVAAAGADAGSVEARRRPRVAIIATGDELVSPGTARHCATAVPDSITAGVAALVDDWGAIVVASDRCGDDPAALTKLAESTVAIADLVITIGGASVGPRDHARTMFGNALVTHFVGVAMRPGRPVWCGNVGSTIVLALPGNPTSAMVCARLFAAPLLVALTGQPTGSALTWRNLPLAAPLAASDARATFTRATWSDAGLIPGADAAAGAQAALVAADWLIAGAANQPALPPGTMVRAVAF